MYKIWDVIEWVVRITQKEKNTYIFLPNIHTLGFMIKSFFISPLVNPKISFIIKIFSYNENNFKSQKIDNTTDKSLHMIYETVTIILKIHK